MATKSSLTPRERLIIPLDECNDVSDAMRLIDKLGPYAGTFKVGLDMITAGCAMTLARHIHVAGAKYMYDGKFYEIPKSMECAVKRIATAGHAMFTVAAHCGRPSLDAAVQAKGKSLMLAVTVLSSLEGQHLLEMGYSKFDNNRRVMDPDLDLMRHAVWKMTTMAEFVGVDGIVCAAVELPIIKHASKNLLRIVTGVRLQGTSPDDQLRVSTPTQAIKAGADMLIMGRPITQAKDPAEVAKRVLDEIAKATA